MVQNKTTRIFSANIPSSKNNFVTQKHKKEGGRGNVEKMSATKSEMIDSRRCSWVGHFCIEAEQA